MAAENIETEISGPPVIENCDGTESIQKLIQPKEHKAHVHLWADLTIDDLDRINHSINPDDIKQIIADIFHLDGWQDDIKQSIVIDLYYYTLMFAKDNNFTREQTSALFTIVKQTHEICIETPFGNIKQTFKFFKDMLLCHSVNRPPHSLELFSSNDIRAISEYVINTYFRHFKMYKYAFTPMVSLDLSLNYIGMPPSPEPSVARELELTEEEEAGEEATEAEQVADLEEATPAPEEENEARKELRALIEKFLKREIEKVKKEVDEQIKECEQVVQQKLENLDDSSAARKNKSATKKKGKASR